MHRAVESGGVWEEKHALRSKPQARLVSLDEVSIDLSISLYVILYIIYMYNIYMYNIYMMNIHIIYVCIYIYIYIYVYIYIHTYIHTYI